MLEANTSSTESVRINPTNQSAEETESHQPLPAKVSLWEAITRGWEWVVFTWRMLQRLGGFGAIVRSLSLVLSLLIKRMLIQWGIIKLKNSEFKVQKD